VPRELVLVSGNGKYSDLSAKVCQRDSSKIDQSELECLKELILKANLSKGPPLNNDSCCPKLS